MNQDNRSTTIAMTLLLAMLVQVVLVFADTRENPARTAVCFTKAYYRLDPAMSRYLCDASKTVDDADTVAQVILNADTEGRERGHDIRWMKQALYNMHTVTLEKTDTEAKVHITGIRRMAINPLYAWVAKIFFLGQSDPVDMVVSLVKENGRWKVCGDLMALARN